MLPLSTQALSILLYHAIPAGTFTPKVLGALGSLQTSLGTKLAKSLPLTFATVGVPMRTTMLSLIAIFLVALL